MNARNNELTTLRESQEAEKLALAETKMNFHKELESKDIMIRDLKAQLIVFQDQSKFKKYSTQNFTYRIVLIRKFSVRINQVFFPKYYFPSGM